MRRPSCSPSCPFFFFNDTATTEIYTLSLHDALPICFLGADEARERLLEHLILAEPEQLGNRIVGLQDLAFEVGNEPRVRGVRDDDVGIQRAARLGAPAVTLSDARLRTEFQPSSHDGPSSRTARGAGTYRPFSDIGPRRTTLITEEEINGQGLKRAQPPTSSGAQISAVRTALPASAFANASLICSSG